MTPDYKDNDPRGWCGDPSRGAALGRADVHAIDRAASVKLYLRRVELDGGGYDRNGTYFGSGPGCLPLYWYADGEGQIDATTRAHNRDDAKRRIAERYPHARFYR
jgi:hypothetical protein